LSLERDLTQLRAEMERPHVTPPAREYDLSRLDSRQRARFDALLPRWREDPKGMKVRELAGLLELLSVASVPREEIPPFCLFCERPAYFERGCRRCDP
jgi:hypothetical protein